MLVPYIDWHYRHASFWTQLKTIFSEGYNDKTDVDYERSQVEPRVSYMHSTSPGLTQIISKGMISESK
jgi:hypothetical protein